MKPEASTLEKPPALNYPVAIVVVTSLVVGFLGLLVAWNLRLERNMAIMAAVTICLLSFLTGWLSVRSSAIIHRGFAVVVGVVGSVICLLICGWVFHTANFQLTASSYPALNAAHVPADLIAELKNAEGTISDTDQQFVADLSSRLGQDHIAPYREALIQSCWNCHQRTALAALAGFCACFCITVGTLSGRSWKIREREPLATSV